MVSIKTETSNNGDKNKALATDQEIAIYDLQGVEETHIHKQSEKYSKPSDGTE